MCNYIYVIVSVCVFEYTSLYTYIFSLNYYAHIIIFQNHISFTVFVCKGVYGCVKMEDMYIYEYQSKTLISILAFCCLAP